MYVFHDVFATWLQISDKGRSVTDCLKVINAQRNIHRVRHGQQMKHCIGAAAQGHDNRDCILKRLLGHDVSWFDVLFQQL